MAAEDGQVIGCHTVEAWNDQLQRGNESKKLVLFFAFFFFLCFSGLIFNVFLFCLLFLIYVTGFLFLFLFFCVL